MISGLMTEYKTVLNSDHFRDKTNKQTTNKLALQAVMVNGGIQIQIQKKYDM